MLRMNTTLATFSCCLLAALSVGCGDDKDPEEAAATFEVLDPGAKHFDKSYSQWGAEWFKWTYQTPYADCELPLDDPTGAYCTAGQDGDVFFLAGSFGPEQKVVTRDECSVPAGKAILFPIMNTVADNAGVVPPMADEANEDAATSNLNMANVEDLFASVDGEDLTDLETFKTDIVEFSYELPEVPNFYSCLGGPELTGEISPAYTGGYYVLLAPLSKGKHKIQFGIDQEDFYSLDVTYNLTVE